jgi:quercetin dioxygenase-like cupin family protein
VKFFAFHHFRPLLLAACSVNPLRYPDVDINVETQSGGRHVSSDSSEMTKARTRRGIQLFRGNDAIPLADSGAMSPMVFDPEDMKALAADGPRSPLIALGIEDTLVFRGEGENGFSLVRAWLGPHYVLPRHTHSGDCLYYIVEGSITMGSQQLGAGDGFLVPSDAPYGYEAGAEGAVVLEFRSDTSFDIKFVGGQLQRWQRMAEVAEVHGETWAESRSDGVS